MRAGESQRRAWFQFALPHGERRGEQVSFQVALPHGERRAGQCDNGAKLIVSIRAPAWGATCLFQAGFWVRTVSIRAPAWGATTLYREFDKTVAVSIRAPAWGATPRDVRNPGKTAVSIRAPAWGATQIVIAAHRRIRFQFALPHGERLTGLTMPPPYKVFQFALPHGERLCVRRPGNYGARFQFALPHGERPQKPQRQHRRRQVSIRAPAWGATTIAACIKRPWVVSIRAPAWGATHKSSLLHTCFGCFNSRSRMGSDAFAARHLQGITAFQFALPHGERLVPSGSISGRTMFQFALPHGERHPLLIVPQDKADVSIRAPAWGATAVQSYYILASKVSIRAPAWGAT